MTDASMNPGARRLVQILFCTIACATNGVALAAEEDAVSRFVDYYQKAYAEGRDLIPAPQKPLDIPSMAARLDLQSITPEGALSGSAFLASDGTVIKLAGMHTTCSMVSLAGLTAMLEEAKAGAGHAFPCHFLGQNAGSPTVRFAECFFMKDGETQSLSQVLISTGVAFAARDRSGRPLFPEYAQAEEVAQKARAGIWARPLFLHPYGECYRANPSMN